MCWPHVGLVSIQFATLSNHSSCGHLIIQPWHATWGMSRWSSPLPSTSELRSLESHLHSQIDGSGRCAAQAAKLGGDGRCRRQWRQKSVVVCGMLQYRSSNGGKCQRQSFEPLQARYWTVPSVRDVLSDGWYSGEGFPQPSEWAHIWWAHPS